MKSAAAILTLAGLWGPPLFADPHRANLNYFIGNDRSRWRRHIPATAGRSGDALSPAYSTFLGGAADDHASAIVSDASGNIYITGYTASPDFPVSSNAVQSNLAPDDSRNAFAAKFDSNGALIYCTYIGGSSEDRALAITVDGAGNAFISGYTWSSDFPSTDGALQAPTQPYEAYRTSFVVKLNAAGDGLLYSATLARGGYNDVLSAIAVGSDGKAVVAGVSASPHLAATAGAAIVRSPLGGYLAKLNATGSAFEFVTGTSAQSDAPTALALDGAGDAYLTGATYAHGPRAIPGGVQPVNSAHSIFSSADGGATWSTAALDDTVVKDLAIDPSDGAVIYASTSGGVLRSSDRGKSWTPVYTESSVVRTFIDPADPNHLISFAEDPYVDRRVPLVTRDGGVTWSKKPMVPFDDIVFDPNQTKNVYAAAPHGVYYSRDGGDTWNEVRGYSGTNFTKPIFDPFNPALMYIASSDGLLYSPDDGLHWYRLLTPPVTFVIADPVRPGTLYGIYGYGYGFTFSADRGQHWTVPIVTARLSKLAIDPSGERLYFFTNDGVWVSTDQGATILPLTNLPANPTIAALYFDPRNPDQQYALSLEGPDAFVEKISANGVSILSSTYLGGSGADQPMSLALDNVSGTIYIGGSTNSTDLNVVNTPYGGGGTDGFVAALSNDCSQVGYVRYLGGAGADSVSGLAIDSAGNLLVAGTTFSADFAVSQTGLSATADISKVFLAGLDPVGSLTSATLLGGSLSDSASGVTLLSDGRTVITGDTNSPDLATTPDAAQSYRNGFADVFLMIFNLLP